MLESPALVGYFVRLEPLSLSHLEGLVAAASQSRETFTFTGVPSDEASTRQYIETALQEKDDGTSIPFAIIAKRQGTVAGSTRFMRIQFWNWPGGSTHQRGAHLPDAVEIGATWLASSAQRTGINTEAKLLMLTHAFGTWRVHRVRLTTDARNARSRNAIERLGAHLDGILRSDHAGYAARSATVHTTRSWTGSGLR